MQKIFETLLKKYQKDFIAEINIEKFSLYLSLLLKWNKAYNLTAITLPEDIVIRHMLDSFSILPYVYGKNIIDVGTGAGFPGIPLALVLPHHSFVLLDSNSKKTRFLEHVVSTLQLSHVRVIHSRAENYYPENCFDSVITRAFSSLKEMILVTNHLCCSQGKFLAMKGVFPQTELDEVPKSYAIEKVVKLQVPHLDADRHLVIIHNNCLLPNACAVF